MRRQVPAALAAAALLAALLPPIEPLPGRSSPDPGDTAWMFAAAAVAAAAVPAFTPRTSVVAAAALAWIGLGFTLAFGRSMGGLLGDPRSFPALMGVGLETAPLAPTVPFASFALFQLVLAVLGAALASRGARRPAWTAGLYVLLVHAPITHWTQHPRGFLHWLGFLDFGGGAAVFLAAGAMALGAGWIGPGIAETPLRPAWLGVGALGVAAGAAGAASPVGVHAVLATAAALAAGALYAPGTGALAAAAAVTCAAGFEPLGAALLTGVAAAAAAGWVEPRSPAPPGAASLAAGAAIGLLSVGIFGTSTLDPRGGDGLIAGSPLLVAWQAIGLVFIASWAYLAAWFAAIAVPSPTPTRLPAP